MKQLLKFNISRKFKNKITIVINILLIVVMYFVFHLDYFFSSDTQIKNVYLDSTTSKYINYYLSDSDLSFNYLLENGKVDQDSVILHYDEGFSIISQKSLNEETVKDIENDLKRVLEKEYLHHHLYLQQYVDEYKNIELTCLITNEDKSELLSTLITIVYFLILSYGTLISNEAIYEKGSRILEVLMTNISAKEYVKSKIISGYLIPLIQFGLVSIYVFINFLIRYRQDKLVGLMEVIGIAEENINLNYEISFRSIILSLILIFLTLITVQIFFLFITASFTSSDDANGFQSLIYVVMLVCYYLMIIYLDESNINSKICIILSYFPLFSSILMSYRLITGSAFTIDVVICCSICIGVLLLMINIGMPRYKNNILNYSSSRKPPPTRKKS